MDIKTVGVVGAGLMGAGIIEQTARCGYQVVAREVDNDAVQAGQRRVEGSMARGVERGKLGDHERQEALSRIAWTTDLNEMRNADLVVEAIIENLEAKQNLFRELDRITPESAILTSNTSSISITALASVTARPDQVAGVHFFNPVPVMGLVELVRGLQSSDATMAALRRFGEMLGKKVVVAKDRPGFIVNLLLVPYLLDAVRAVENGTASVEDIDTAMLLGTNVPMGPLTLLDFVGIDTTLYIADVMYDEFRDPKYAAPPLLRKMVRAGYYGRKRNSRGGFYDYSGAQPVPSRLSF